jgi:protein-S-isoprenylcysteine O-methyltransferase Ste14
MVLLACYWLFYFALHSLLAAPRVKQAVAVWWPASVRFYRLAFNQLSVWLFLAGMRYQTSLAAEPFWAANTLNRTVGIGLLVGGVAVAVLALRGYNLQEFSGWGYVQKGAGAAKTELHTSGLNAVVRHPLYVGVLLGLAGWLVLYPTAGWLVFGGCTWAYVLVGSRLEERKLHQEFGPAYAVYCQQVGRLWPRRQRAVEPEIQ